jgi:hypothetical protein
MTIAVVLFAIAAAGGLVLALLRFRGRDLPMPLALIHGVVAAAGLALLAWAAFGAASSSPARASLAVFGVAAIGGFVLFARHLRNKVLPVPLVVGHAVLAVAGFVLLLSAVNPS